MLRKKWFCFTQLLKNPLLSFLRKACLHGAVVSSLRAAIVTWINFTSVIPWLDHGIQLKILKLLVFFIVFMDPVVKRTR
ncbi:hypothetical protein [Rickettsia monacensis]|uniref:hypothetical protein n=1 Tax=Rickettsia monacensis TaxID=109232 RepID=UPI001F587BB2|nr:hypothetical protein [Rickettsia monacensis]